MRIRACGDGEGKISLQIITKYFLVYLTIASAVYSVDNLISIKDSYKGCMCVN